MTTKSHSSESKFNRPHTIVPQDDTAWAIEQKPCILRFWQQCWLADPYGSRWMKIVTKLSNSAFRLARRVLEAARLFVFRRISYGSDGRSSIWEVRNLHGTRVKDFWQGENSEADTASNKSDTTTKEMITALNKAPISVETQSEQASQESSGTPQEHITNSSKEFVMCNSDAPATNSGEDETAHAPLGGASPQMPHSTSEEEESPVVTDSTSLTLVDATESQSALLNKENQDSGDDAIALHEDTCSAPQVEVVTSLDKWSDEAIVKRRELRPERENKLKLAAMLGENPGFEFLTECWEDVALWLKVKQLIAKYPEWGIKWSYEGVVRS